MLFCNSKKIPEIENKKKHLKEQEILYQEGYLAVEERLNLINIVKRIQKLEAGLGAVIKDDDALIS